jgi:hypothetical protein
MRFGTELSIPRPISASLYNLYKCKFLSYKNNWKNPQSFIFEINVLITTNTILSSTS